VIWPVRKVFHTPSWPQHAGSRIGAIPPDLGLVYRVCTTGPLADHLHPRRLSRGFSSPQRLRCDRSEARPRGTALSSNAPRFLPAPPPGFGYPPDGLLPIAPRETARGRSAALARFTLRSFPSTGWVPVSRPLPSCGSLVALHAPAAGPLQGFVPRPKYLEVLDRPSGSPLGFTSRVFPSAALAVGFCPVPSSSTLCAHASFGNVHPASWSLAQQRSRLAVSGCRPFWFFRPCGHAGCSPRPTPTFEKIRVDGSHPRSWSAEREHARGKISGLSLALRACRSQAIEATRVRSQANFLVRGIDRTHDDMRARRAISLHLVGMPRERVSSLRESLGKLCGQPVESVRMSRSYPVASAR
jgi:hypothetical protein